MLNLIYSLEGVLREMAEQGKRHFSPHYICAQSGIADIKCVTKYLLSEVGKKLNVYYEIECPQGDSDFTISRLEDLSFEKRNCHICGLEYTPNPEKIWIAFDFHPEYLEGVKKKKLNVNLSKMY